MKIQQWIIKFKMEKVQKMVRNSVIKLKIKFKAKKNNFCKHYKIKINTLI